MQTVDFWTYTEIPNGHWLWFCIPVQMPIVLSKFTLTDQYSCIPELNLIKQKKDEKTALPISNWPHGVTVS